MARETVDLYNDIVSFEELKGAFISMRQEYDAHKHDGSNSKQLDEIQADFISATTKITVGIGNNVVVLDGQDSTYRLYVGNADPASAAFRVTKGGVMTLTGAGSSISIVSGGNTVGLTPSGTNAIFAGTTGSPEFKVTPGGVLTATGATVSGTINASAGTFSGSITVSGTLTGGTIRTSSGNDRVVLNGSANQLEVYTSNVLRSRFSSGQLVFNDANANNVGFIAGGSVSDLNTLIIDAANNLQLISGANMEIRPGGTLKIQGAPLPNSDNGFALGSASFHWSTVWLQKLNGRTLNENVIDLSIQNEIAINQPLNFTAGYTLERGGTTRIFMDSANTEHSAHFVPTTSAANYNLGSSGQRWATVFSQNADDISSDIRFKENIKELNYGLKEVLKMNSISYDKQGRHLGFSAQQMRKIVPEIVTGRQDKKGLGIKYTEIIPILVKAIQEQQEQINQLCG